jgi:hypothetical protein
MLHPWFRPFEGKIPIRKNLALCVLLRKHVVRGKMLRENLVSENLVRDKHVTPSFILPAH